MLTRKSILSFRPLSPMHSFGIGRFVRCEFTPAFASASVTSPRREECGPRIQPGPSVAKETRHRNHHNVHRHLLPTNGVSLSPSQVKDLLRGRFPADYERDVIVLKDVPYREYRKIVDAFNYSRAREEHPSGHLLLDSKFSTLSVLRAPPTAVHEALTYRIGRTVENALVQATQEGTGTRFRVSLNSRATPAFDFTTKVPDVQIERLIASPNRRQVKTKDTLFIAEVGFKESGPELERSIREWLEKQKETRLAFLIKFHENPRFDSKLAFNNLPEFIKADPEKHAATDISNTEWKDGCVQVHGNDFVGRIKAYFEVWKRDRDTGNVVIRGTRIPFYSSMKDLNPPKIEIDVTEFGLYPSQDVKVEIDWEEWIFSINLAAQDLALARLHDTLRKHGPKKQKQGDSPGKK